MKTWHVASDMPRFFVVLLVNLKIYCKNVGIIKYLLYICDVNDEFRMQMTKITSLYTLYNMSV